MKLARGRRGGIKEHDFSCRVLFLFQMHVFGNSSYFSKSILIEVFIYERGDDDVTENHIISRWYRVSPWLFY